MKLYQTLIRPVVTYGCEACVLSARNMNVLRVFERKIIRKEEFMAQYLRTVSGKLDLTPR